MEIIKQKFSTAIFDLDGTIADTGEGIVNSVKYALAKFGIEESSTEKLHKFIGPPLTVSFGELYDLKGDQALTAVRYYREYYSEKGIDENTLYDGIETLLDRIKKSGRKIILATCKPEQFAIHILRSHGIDKYFDLIAGATMDTTRITKTAVLSYALASLDTQDRANAVMIGDRKFDILGAKEFNIPTIAVTYGYGSKKELIEAGAKYISNSVEEIYGFL